MTTLLIDQERAEDIFAGLCQMMERCRRTTEAYMAPNWPIDMNDDFNNVAASIAEVEALISQAAKVTQSIPDLSKRLAVSYESQPIKVGRPAHSLSQKVDQILALEQQRAEATDTATKLALGKQIRRIRRTIATAPALAAQLTPESFYEAAEDQE